MTRKVERLRIVKSAKRLSEDKCMIVVVFKVLFFLSSSFSSCLFFGVEV